jgi:hypothetical protein
MSLETLITEFVVTSPEQRDIQLYDALSLAKAKALLDQEKGILITRMDFGRFSVSLSASVPYGYIHELDQVRGLTKMRGSR